MKVLVTGASGLIGSEAVEYDDLFGHQVLGVDNNMRAEFFGFQADTSWKLNRLKDITKNFEFYTIYIRDRQRVFELFETNPFDLIIHCAAHPCHNKACQIPLLDFEVNVSDLRKLKSYFPESQITRSLTDILEEIVAAEQERYAKV